MKKVIIDTNLLVSFVTDRNPEQQEKAAFLFKKAARLKHTVICHLNVITEFVYVMEKIYRIDPFRVNEIMSDLFVMPGVSLACEIDLKTVLRIWPSSVTDYGDALVAALGMKSKNATIATFDKKFIKALSGLCLPIHTF